MQSTGDEHYWLGTNSVLPNNNRVTVPTQVRDSNLVQPNEELFWGAFKHENRILVSRFKRSFSTFRNDVYGDIVRFTSRSVQDTGTAIIPAALFDDYEGKAKWAQPIDQDLRFDYGETLHFLTTDKLYRYGLCYVLNDEDGRDMVDENYGEALAPDGGQKTTQKDRIVPEAVFDGDAFHVETSERVNFRQLKIEVFQDLVQLKERSVEIDGEQVSSEEFAEKLLEGESVEFDVVEEASDPGPYEELVRKVLD